MSNNYGVIVTSRELTKAEKRAEEIRRKTAKMQAKSADNLGNNVLHRKAWQTVYNVKNKKKIGQG